MRRLIVVFIVFLLVGCGEMQDATPAPTPTPFVSDAARNIPMNQLTNIDFISMTFAERQQLIAVAMQGIHCPRGVTGDTLVIDLSHDAEMTAGQAQNLIYLLSMVATRDGCVAR